MGGIFIFCRAYEKAGSALKDHRVHRGLLRVSTGLLPCGLDKIHHGIKTEKTE